MVQLESADAARDVENELSTWRGSAHPALAVSCPYTLKPTADMVLEKNFQLPANLVSKELAANMEAIMKTSFPKKVI